MAQQRPGNDRSVLEVLSWIVLLPLFDSTPHALNTPPSIGSVLTRMRTLLSRFGSPLKGAPGRGDAKGIRTLFGLSGRGVVVWFGGGGSSVRTGSLGSRLPTDMAHADLVASRVRGRMDP